MDVTDFTPIPCLANAHRMATKAYSGAGITGDIKDLITEIPDIEAINLRLAGFLSMKVIHPHSSRPLFYVCVMDGLTAAGSMGRYASISQKREAYLNTLIDRSSLILRYEIYDDNGVWDPLYGQPLVQWIATSSNHILDPRPSSHHRMIPPQQFKDVLRKRLCCDLRPETESMDCVKAG